MPCRVIRSVNGITAIACGSLNSQRRERCSCGGVATIACDHPLTGAKEGKTCDRALCGRCATRVGPNKHLCQAHARAAQKDSVKP